MTDRIAVPRERFASWRRRLAEKIVAHPLEIIQWEATRKCDMRCAHCGSPSERAAASRELTTYEIKWLFRDICETIDMPGFRFLTVTGGEPFLRGDLLDVLGYVHTSFGWVSTIQTNGRYLAGNPSVISEMLSCGVRGIGLDLDGTEPFHDSIRGEPGHFRATVELVGRLLVSSDDLFVTVTTVVTPENIGSLGALWPIIRELNPHRWRLLPIETIGRSESARSLSGEELAALMRFVYERRLEAVDERVVQTELGCIGWLGTEWEGLVRPYVFSCIAGKTCLGILYDGSFSGCAHIDHAYIQGNVRIDKVADVWSERYGVFRDTPSPKQCTGCPEAEFCTVPMHKFGLDRKMRECVFQTMKPHIQGGE
jgi:radical SAM protein with 4Fe4S-binding SPASM domain